MTMAIDLAPGVERRPVSISFGSWATVLLVITTSCASGNLRRNASSASRFEQVTIPASIGGRAYRWQRGIYDSLPLDHPQRDAFRTRLANHLLAQAEGRLRRGDLRRAFESFSGAATLYDPSEVYTGPLKDQRLHALAAQIVSRGAPRGDVERLLPALCVQISLRRDNVSLRDEFARIVRWLDTSSEALHGRIAAGKRSIPILEQAADIWPSRFLLDALHGLYLKRLVALSREQNPRAFHRGRFQFAAIQWTGYSIARMYLWVDRPSEAFERLPASASEGRDDVLRKLLREAAAPKASFEARLQLASLFDRRDPEVALRVCRRAAEAFPEAAQAHACVGRLAARTEKIPTAVAAYATAYRLAPGKRSYAEQLATQYQQQLFRLIESEQLTEAERSLPQITVFYRSAEKRLGRRLDPPLSKVYYALGFGQYNAGRIAQAIKSLGDSLKASPSPEALIQLATIDVKAGNGTAALGYLARAESLRLSPTQWLYWRCRIAQLRAKSLGVKGDAVASRAEHHRANELWDRWLSLDLPPEVAAEGLVHRAESLFEDDRAAEAIDSLEKAIDASPGRKETYADVVAMLTSRGHLPEALDALHRALGRPEVTPYLKTYCSFWVIGLARRAKQPPDPLAMRYLQQLPGSRWYNQLAKFVLGKLSIDQLTRAAHSRAQRAEMWFYQGDRLFADGKEQQARALWQRVIDTKMLAFFEFDMAWRYLRRGTPVPLIQPVDRRPSDTPAAQQPNTARR